MQEEIHSLAADCRLAFNFQLGDQQTVEYLPKRMHEQVIS